MSGNSRRYLTGLFSAAILLAGVAVVAARRDAIPSGPDAASDTLLPTSSILSVGHATFSGNGWYVSDWRAHRVHLLDNAGHLVRSLGRRGSGPGEFVSPSAVAAATYIYVAEEGRRDISVFDSLGTFLRYLRMPGPCAHGRVAALATAQFDLYVLRLCVESAGRLRYRVERSSAGAPLEIWSDNVFTVAATEAGGVPIHFPILAASPTRLVTGDGGALCLQVFHLPDGRAQPDRCLHELPRLPIPAAEREEMSKRWRGRVAVPDSLPRIVAANLFGNRLTVAAVDGAETASWLELAWSAGAAPVRLGRAAVQTSFLGPQSQLIARDDAEGVRVEVVPIER